MHAAVTVGIEAPGAPRALAGVFSAVRRGGVLVPVGTLPVGEGGAELGIFVTWEIDYRGSYRFVDEITEAITLMDGGVDVSPLMTHSFALDDAQDAFAVAGERDSGSSKVMLQFA